MARNDDKTNFWDFAREHGEAITACIAVSVIAICIATYHCLKVWKGAP